MTAEQVARERIVVGLRRRDGLARDAFRAVSGLDLDLLVGDAVTRRGAQGLATDDGRCVRLAHAGLLVSDALWGDVVAP